MKLTHQAIHASKRALGLLAAMLLTVSLSAQEKMTFVVDGPEETYNQIRVVNKTSIEQFRCRVVLLDENDKIKSDYGTYNLDGKNDSDSNTNFIHRGTKVGIQLPNDMDAELTFTVEYIDRPVFDYIVIQLYDKQTGFSSEF